MSQALEWKRHALQLEEVVRNVLWMARRYADFRGSYAPSLYNDQVRLLQGMGFPLPITEADGTIWARSCFGAVDSGLSQEEFALGKPAPLWQVTCGAEELDYLRKQNNALAQSIAQFYLLMQTLGEAA